MLPNDYLSYEFRLPRLTLESTKAYKLKTSGHNRPQDGVSHHWRAPLNSLPSSLSLPRNGQHSGVTLSHIYRVVGYDDPLRPATINIDDDDPVVIDSSDDDDDDDDDDKPNTKRAKVDTTTTTTQNAQATNPVPTAPAPALKPTTPTPPPKCTTPVKYSTVYVPLSSPTTAATTTDVTLLPGRILRRLPSLTIARPIELPIPNCPVVIPPVGRAFDALCGELDEAESQTTSTALITKGPFGLTSYFSRPPPTIEKLYTYFPHYDRDLLDAFYVWLIQPENIVKSVPQIIEALEIGNQTYEQAKNPALAVHTILGPRADIADIVTLLTRYDFRLLLEFYAYEMRIENKAGKTFAQLLDELEEGHRRWTRDVTAPRHSRVNPGIIYTLEMMFGRYDQILLSDLVEWVKLSMSAAEQEGKAQDPEKQKEWSNARLIQLLEEEHQRREEMKRVELETKEAERRLREQLEQQEKALDYQRAVEERYFREQFWSNMDTMEVEKTGKASEDRDSKRRVSSNAMDIDDSDDEMGGYHPFGRPRPPVAGTIPMDLGPEIDMDDMDMGADSETEEQRRERYREQARLKNKDITKKEDYVELFISPRKQPKAKVSTSTMEAAKLAAMAQARKIAEKKKAEKEEFDLAEMRANRRSQKPEEKRAELERLKEQQRREAARQLAKEQHAKNKEQAKEQAKPEVKEQPKEQPKEPAVETAAEKSARQLLEVRQKQRERAERERAEREKQEQHRGRPRGGSTSSVGGRPRRGSSSHTRAPSVSGRPRGSSMSKPPAPTTPSRKPKPEGTDDIVDENPMALVLSRPKPPTLNLKPTTPPNSGTTPGGDDPFGPVPGAPAPKDTKDASKLDPKPKVSFAGRSGMAAEIAARRLEKFGGGGAPNPTAKPSTGKAGPSPGRDRGPGPGPGAGRPRTNSGATHPTGGRTRTNSTSGNSPTRIGRRPRTDSNSSRMMGATSTIPFPNITEATIKKADLNKTVNIMNPMDLALGGDGKGGFSFANIGLNQKPGERASGSMDISGSPDPHYPALSTGHPTSAAHPKHLKHPTPAAAAAAAAAARRHRGSPPERVVKHAHGPKHAHGHGRQQRNQHSYKHRPLNVDKHDVSMGGMVGDGRLGRKVARAPCMSDVLEVSGEEDDGEESEGDVITGRVEELGTDDEEGLGLGAGKDMGIGIGMDDGMSFEERRLMASMMKG